MGTTPIIRVSYLNHSKQALAPICIEVQEYKQATVFFTSHVFFSSPVRNQDTLW